jgi:hypothetical protein
MKTIIGMLIEELLEAIEELLEGEDVSIFMRLCFSGFVWLLCLPTT